MTDELQVLRVICGHHTWAKLALLSLTQVRGSLEKQVFAVAPAKAQVGVGTAVGAVLSLVWMVLGQDWEYVCGLDRPHE